MRSNRPFRWLRRSVVPIGLLCGAAVSARSDEGRPADVTSDTMGGEWTGITPEKERIVVMRVDEVSRRAVLAVTEQVHSDIVTQLYDLGQLRVFDGQFSGEDNTSGVKIDGNAKCYPGSAFGTARVTLPGRKGQQTFQAYLFRWQKESWAKRVTQLYQSVEGSP